MTITPSVAPSPTPQPESVQVLDTELEVWLGNFKLPEGFSVSYIGMVPNPTTVIYGPDERLYVASMIGNIYVFNQNDTPEIYAEGYTLPIGLAFRPDSMELYVASRDPEHTSGKLSVVKPDGSIQYLLTDLPCCYTPIYHQPDSLVFGPDGYLYMSIGARSDHGELSAEEFAVPGELHPLEAGILRISPDASTIEKYANGMRNPYDLAFDANGQLFANDNGEDYGPPDELNRVEVGGHYGWPYDPCQICFPKPPDLIYHHPFITFPPHTSPTGLVAYTAAQFPDEYWNTLFMTTFTGGPETYTLLNINSETGEVRAFAAGFGAPTDVTVAPDGSLTVADWHSGRIVRVSYR